MKIPKQLLLIGLIAIAIALPFIAYPIFLMKILCFALFAAAFNLLLGYTGLLSFGHAAFLAALDIVWVISCVIGVLVLLSPFFLVFYLPQPWAPSLGV